ncbi:uncharacterized protein LOC116016066 [Ipomoea triloba]|uniref:uncharacterized protein LOC116016066 n=1 Tax=Ipomoea triloba TaxID=35885 RepID=UPI00125CDB8D|nr:uncharacterized protein LOC116016066 [Ipomoea triloba]
MNSAKVVFVLFSLFLVGFWSWKGGRADALTPAECKEERRILVNACKAVITKRPPTAFCCERLRVTHVECVCPVITPTLAALIDVNYAIKVIQGCGRQVPRHFKCGSITTP